jgi:N-acyl-D-amino-acid deacylase
VFDLIVLGGLVVDGSGRPGQRCDIGIEDGRIVALRDLHDIEAKRLIDARGLVVAPGFVDPHSHSDWTLQANPGADSTIRQGVTTEIVGNCGISNAPVSERSEASVRFRLASCGYPHPPTWRSFHQYLEQVGLEGTSQNLAFFVGHSAMREAVGVGPRPAAEDEILQMTAYLEEALDAGALGLSTGLEYSAGRYADTGELVELAKVVGHHGGWYSSHIRNRDAGLLGSVNEFLEIVRVGGCAGQVSHLNVRHDTGAPLGAWREAVELTARARQAGLDVEADATPFREGLGLMIGLLPEWLLSEGLDAAAQLVMDRAVRDRLRGDCDRYWRFVHKGQWHRVRLQSSPQFPEWAGLTFPEIAALAGKDEWECYFDILAAAGPAMGTLRMVGQLFTDEHLAEIIAHPLFSLGVDAMTSSIAGPLAQITNSPLSYRGHVEYLSHHVREQHTLSLEEAIHKMSGKPAQRFGLRQRGLVREGWFADLVVLNPDVIGSRSTFEHPGVYPEGIEAVIVNGSLTVDCGSHTGARAGKVLGRQTLS